MSAIDRAFVRLPHGLVHYRSAGAGGQPPLLMLHASPASSVLLQPVMAELAHERRCIAPDTPGNGDSSPLVLEQPELPDYAAAMLRFMDGLFLDTVDIYGSHTGAHIAAEIAIARPDRVRRLVLDGLGMWPADERRELLEHYAPEVTPDAIGSQMLWATQFVRDQAWFFPYYRRDAAHNRGLGALSAESLHVTTVEVLKAIGTYHLAYRAVFRSIPQERLPMVGAASLVIADGDDPLRDGAGEAVRLLPHGRLCTIEHGAAPDGRRRKIEAMRAFLDAP